MVSLLHIPHIPHKGARVTRRSRPTRRPWREAAEVRPRDISQDGAEIFPGVPPAGTTASFDGGAVVVDPRCAVLFYGTAWKSNDLSANAETLLLAFSSVINNSPYLSHLGGYGVGSGVVLVGESRIVDKDPPNPFGPGDGSDVVSSAIDSYYSKLDPRYQPNMYSVILPPGVAFVSEDGDAQGYHAEGDGNYYAVVLNGDVDTITYIFCHEFVETATDATGDGWQVDPRSDTTWNEICDVCENLSQVRINGVAVAPYFASYVGGQACLVPLPPPPPVPPPVLPNGDYEITKAAFRSSSGIDYIWAVGGPIGSDFWTLTTDVAITRMRAGELSFYTMSESQRANVVLGHSLVAAYLTTTADDTQLNNLDYIATHSTLPEEPIFWQ